jgi:hypothetical protein
MLSQERYRQWRPVISSDCSPLKHLPDINTAAELATATSTPLRKFAPPQIRLSWPGILVNLQRPMGQQGATTMTTRWSRPGYRR